MWLWDGIPFLLQDLSEVSQHGVISHTSSYNTSDLIPHLGWGLGCWQAAQSNFISQEETKNRRRELDFKDHQITWSGSWPIFLCMFCVMHLQDTDDCTHNKCLLFLHHTVKRKSHVGKKSEGRDGTVWEKIKKWSKGVDSVVSTKKTYKITTTEHNLSPVLLTWLWLWTCSRMILKNPQS